MPLETPPPYSTDSVSSRALHGYYSLERAQSFFGQCQVVGYQISKLIIFQDCNNFKENAERHVSKSTSRLDLHSLEFLSELLSYSTP